MATHSSTLAWRIPWTEEAGGLQSMGCKELDMTKRQHTHTRLISEAKAKEEARGQGGLVLFLLLL